MTMTTDTLRTAIIAALKHRDPNANLWQYPTESDRALWTAVCRRVEVAAKGYGAVADLDALRALAVACGLREAPCPACDGRGRRAYGREVEDGCDECECAGVVVVDPEEERERLTRELAAARSTVDQLLGVVGAHGGEVARLQFDRESEAARHAETLVAMRVADVASERDALRDELAATRAALRANLRCDECDDLATRVHADTARFGCDAHGVGEGWADTTHAAVVREALR